jgi:uncharacterized protein (TIGR01370 family)
MVILKIIIIFCFSLVTTISWAATYYIRSDGGTADQCNGLTDAAYPGSGINQPCAWVHPFWALDSNGSWKISSSDTLIIDSGSYMMGYGAPNTSWCEAEAAYGCYLPPLPSGTDSQNPTRILGKGWDSGCSNPPELWGTQRTYYILNLEGTSNAVIDCLEITDHSGCAEFHGNSSVRCERDTYPYGEWAERGIYASDSSNVNLRHLNIHGLSGSGIHAGRLSNWTVEDVRIAGNGLVGWDGDLWDGDDSNSGTITFRRFTVEWNGCVETYPGEQPDHCWAQSAGGYGDGIGTGRTGGHWIIEDSIIRYNTSDGIDLLYVVGADNSESLVEIIRTAAVGNAGNQMKIGGASIIINSLAVGNCGFFYQKSFAQEMGDKQSGDQCRAGGATISFSPGQNDSALVINSTVVGQGWALIEADCITMAFPDQPPCNGSEYVTLNNNIFYGYQYFLRDDEVLAHFVGDGDPGGFTTGHVDYNIIHNTQILSWTGPNNISQDPLFINSNLDNFDGHLQSGSPAIDSATSAGAPSDDYESNPRPQGAGYDIGAYEYQQGGPPPTTGPNISVSPSSYNFGSIDVGSSSSPQTFTISNSGTADLIVSSVSITGSDSDQFTLQVGTCTTLTPTISAGGSCTVTVTFSPTSEGSKSATLQIASNDTDTSTLNVSLSGSGSTQTADLPDLTGTWSSMVYTCKETSSGTKCKIKGVLNIQNTGNEAAGATVRFYLSNDSVYDGADSFLSEVWSGNVKPERSKNKKLKYKFPIGETAGGKYVIALIDADNEVSEINENNNNIPYGPFATDEYMGNIQGTIIDATTQNPIAGATVSVQGTAFQAITDSLGQYSIQDIPTGIYTLVVTATGYNSQTSSVNLNANDTITVDFSLVAATVQPSWTVNDFAYQLQNIDLTAMGNTQFDLFIIDYSSDGSEEMRFTAEQVSALKNSPGGLKLILAYMSIGEAETYRWYWNNSWDTNNDGNPDAGAPSWLGPSNPDWPGNYKVRYWESEWQSIIYGPPNSYLDKIIDTGFDGVYLDIIDAYEYWGPEGESGLNRATAAQDMVDFVKAIANYARVTKGKTDFGVFPQNGEALSAYPDYVAAVTGIGREDTWYMNNNARPSSDTEYVTSHLDVFKQAGKLVLVIDYVTQQSLIDDFYAKATAKGYVPYVTHRDLDRLTINAGHEPD